MQYVPSLAQVAFRGSVRVPYELCKQRLSEMSHTHCSNASSTMRECVTAL